MALGSLWMPVGGHGLPWHPQQIPAIINSTGLPVTAMKKGLIYPSCETTFTLLSVSVHRELERKGTRETRSDYSNQNRGMKTRPSVQVPLKGNEEGEISKVETLL